MELTINCQSLIISSIQILLYSDKKRVIAFIIYLKYKKTRITISPEFIYVFTDALYMILFMKRVSLIHSANIRNVMIDMAARKEGSRERRCGKRKG